ncbi:hypothetical protein HPB51_027729 [Rhipicephalus microplus]|uniref:HAT C-terminal dimerisation domain-containing protein n=1 Tax=Rhipicephalus microplus TaxID=6941 RepID=A0A9J6CZB3_RHIMP|nr:hypothetical protein HPB51_027729 [Rhipicephalus microplus]
MKLFEDLMLLVKSTAAKVSLPTSRYDLLTVNINEYLDPNPYFGHRFETALRDACLPRDDKNELRLRSRQFIVELFNQLRQRLPENIQCLQKASLLSLEHALKATQKPITELAAQFLSVEAVSACETQWRNLRHMKWCCTDTTDGFWAEVGSYRDAHGDNPFAELDTLAMTVLSLPFSNAGVERCFSDRSIVKSKRRNRLDIYTLNALLTYGFSSVVFAEGYFRDSALSKGRKLRTANYVYGVEETVFGSNSPSEIAAKCNSQVKQASNDVKVQLTLKRELSASTCSCKAGTEYKLGVSRNLNLTRTAMEPEAREDFEVKIGTKVPKAIQTMI